MKIGKPDPRGVQKPVVWIDGGIHAREWISPASVMYIVHELLEKSGHHLSMLTKYDFYIMPMMNPDGYEYTHTADREAFQYGGALTCSKPECLSVWGWGNVLSTSPHPHYCEATSMLNDSRKAVAQDPVSKRTLVSK